MERDLLEKLEQQANNQETPRSSVAEADEYVPPKVVVHDGDDFIRLLGPAQACSPVSEEDELITRIQPFRLLRR